MIQAISTFLKAQTEQSSARLRQDEISLAQYTDMIALYAKLIKNTDILVEDNIITSDQKSKFMLTIAQEKSINMVEANQGVTKIFGNLIPISLWDILSGYVDTRKLALRIVFYYIQYGPLTIQWIKKYGSRLILSSIFVLLIRRKIQNR